MSAEVTSDARERAERLRAYFTVQVAFARRIADLGGGSPSQAALVYTPLHRRLGLGRATQGPAPGWAPIARILDRADIGEAVDEVVAAFAASPAEKPDPNRVGCFSFDPPNDDGLIRLHFTNRDSADGAGPLAAEKQDRRRAELAALVARMREQHPQARAVGGGSWLYNLPAYRRLFPPAYVASAEVPAAVRLDGTSTWGQLVDHRGAIRLLVRDAVIGSLASLDLSAPWAVFPLRALRTRAPLAVFERFYEGLAT